MLGIIGYLLILYSFSYNIVSSVIARLFNRPSPDILYAYFDNGIIATEWCRFVARSWRFDETGYVVDLNTLSIPPGATKLHIGVFDGERVNVFTQSLKDPPNIFYIKKLNKVY